MRNVFTRVRLNALLSDNRENWMPLNVGSSTLSRKKDTDWQREHEHQRTQRPAMPAKVAQSYAPANEMETAAGPRAL